MSRDNNRLTQDIVIPCYATDANKRLKLVSFMDYAQELANRHATQLGFGYDSIITSRQVWVLSRMHVIFHDCPEWRDEVRLSTWHKGACGLFYLRDFLMSGAAGNQLVTATTSWVVLDIDSRRFVRNPAFGDNGETVCKDNAVEEPCPKVQIPKELAKIHVADHHVSYSDVDFNGHTNNAMYLFWAMDQVDYEVASSRPLKEMKINFNHETRPGEMISLFVAKSDEEGGVRYYVEGHNGDLQVFCTELVF